MSRAATFLRNLLRFRLRTLLLAVLVISVALGIFVNRVKRQQASVAAIKRLGGWAYYDYQLTDDHFDPQGESWAPAWLRRKLGDDYFHSVLQVNMVYNDDTGQRLDNGEMTDEVLPHLDGLPRIEMLLLHGTQASDGGLAHIGKLQQLRRLYIWNGTRVTDAGVAHLAGCQRLDYLHLSGSQIGDDGVRTLSQLPRLEGLSLQGNRLTDKGLAHVGRMRQLKDLWIGEVAEQTSRISDAGLVHLANLPRLEELDLQNTAVTAEGLVHLEGVKTLKSLLLQGTAVTDVSRLQAALPQCKIDVPPPQPTPPGP